MEVAGNLFKPDKNLSPFLPKVDKSIDTNSLAMWKTTYQDPSLTRDNECPMDDRFIMGDNTISDWLDR
jgi:hypothetical protein